MMEVRRVRGSDVLGGFGSGNADLDRYLHQYAKQNDRRHWNATWIAVDDGEVAGFATVVAGAVEAKELESVLPKLPQYPAPILRLARLAADQHYTGKGVASALLQAVFQAAVEQAERTGCVGVFADAKPGAVTFYEKLGFVTVHHPETGESTAGMFLPLAAVRARLSPRSG